MSRGLDIMRDHADAVGMAVGKAGVIGGSASAFFFGLTASEFAAISGVVVAVMGLLIQWHYNRRKDKREYAEHIQRMVTYRARNSVSAD